MRRFPLRSRIDYEREHMSQLRFFSATLSTTASPTRQSVMEQLEDFCHEVSAVTAQKVDCLLVPGFITNLGQEYRATAHSQKSNIDHILFRAHVPLDGLPVNFDFYGDEMIPCEHVSDVAKALARFADQNSTRETLRLLSQ
jgi:hypothetical protein